MTITYEYEGALYVNLTNKCNCKRPIRPCWILPKRPRTMFPM